MSVKQALHQVSSPLLKLQEFPVKPADRSSTVLEGVRVTAYYLVVL